jgi:hypothetical protein
MIGDKCTEIQWRNDRKPDLFLSSSSISLEYRYEKRIGNASGLIINMGLCVDFLLYFMESLTIVK